MSLTKHIDSLPQAEQDAILGVADAGIDPDYEAYWSARESMVEILGHADPDTDYEAEYDEWVAYQPVEINGLSEPKETTVVDENFQPIR